MLRSCFTLKVQFCMWELNSDLNVLLQLVAEKVSTNQIVNPLELKNPINLQSAIVDWGFLFIGIVIFLLFYFFAFLFFKLKPYAMRIPNWSVL